MPNDEDTQAAQAQPMASPELIKEAGLTYAKDLSRELIRQRRESKQAQEALPAEQLPEEPEPEAIANIDEDSELLEYNDAITAAGNKKSYLERLKTKAAKAIGNYQISKFQICTILAVCKDLFDLGTLETASWIDWLIDLCIGIMLFIFLWGRGGTRWKSKLIVRFLIVLFGEILPILGVLPMWTIAVLWAWLKAASKKDDAFIALKIIDTALEELVKVAQVYTPKESEE